MVKICELCGQPFETNRPIKKICDRKHERICMICGKKFEVPRSQKDKQTCSKECMKVLISTTLKSEEVRARTAATNLERYGAATPCQSDEIKQRVVQRNLDKFGVTHPSKLEDNKRKRAATNLKRYGYEHVSQVKQFQNKASQTTFERFGVYNASQSEEIKQKKKDTTLEHYGVDNPMKSKAVQLKSIHTNRLRYGVDHPMQSDEVKQKVISTNRRNLGVDYPFQSPEIWDKLRATNLEKYGDEVASRSPQIVAKVRDTTLARYGGYTLQVPYLINKVYATNLEKYGTIYPSQNPEIKQKVRETNKERFGYSYTFESEEMKEKSRRTCMDKYGVPYNCMRPEAKGHSVISKVNLYWAEVIQKQLGLQVEFEKNLENRSFDLWVKDTNLLLEIDPTVTHNSFMSVYDAASSGLDPTYHRNKSVVASRYGYRCVHVFDWDEPDKIIELINPHKTIVYARQGIVKSLDLKTCNEFLNRYHLQGSVRGQVVCYGLYFNDDLVQVMTFGKPRYNPKFEWELLRLCSRSSVRVVGGANRLFQHFIRDRRPSSIISYCDISKFSGNVYKELGMTLKEVASPAKVWSKDNMRITDNLLRQRGYDQLFNANYGKGISNEQLMLNHDWLPVYDCGQAVYEWIAE